MQSTSELAQGRVRNNRRVAIFPDIVQSRPETKAPENLGELHVGISPHRLTASVPHGSIGDGQRTTQVKVGFNLSCATEAMRQ
jgi:hypothetical protein